MRSKSNDTLIKLPNILYPKLLTIINSSHELSLDNIDKIVKYALFMKRIVFMKLSRSHVNEEDPYVAHFSFLVNKFATIKNISQEEAFNEIYTSLNNITE